MSRMMTSRELMSAVGLTGRNTLVRYHKAGLIPPPEVRKHPSGRGMTSYWEEWVVLRLQRIKKLTDAGKTRSEIKDFLGTDWSTAKLDFEKDSESDDKLNRLADEKNQEATARELFKLIERTLKDIGLRVSKIREYEINRYMTDVAIGRGIELLSDGFRPVLIIQKGKVYISCDTAMAFRAQTQTALTDTFLVIPITTALSKAVGRASATKSQAEAKLNQGVRLAGEDYEVAEVREWDIDVSRKSSKRSSTAKPRKTSRSRVINLEK